MVDLKGHRGAGPDTDALGAADQGAGRPGRRGAAAGEDGAGDREGRDVPDVGDGRVVPQRRTPRRADYIAAWGAWFGNRRKRALIQAVVDADDARLSEIERAIDGRWEMFDAGEWRPTGSAWLAAKVHELGGRIRLA